MVEKIRERIKNKLVLLYSVLRVYCFGFLSNCQEVIGKPVKRQPVLLLGRGLIKFCDNVQIGYFPSAFFFSNYSHIEARHQDAKIIIGENTVINNNVVIIAEHKSIIIGENCLMGTNVEIINSDFHTVSFKKRGIKPPICEDVFIGDNVMLGNNVKILKGVHIGEGCFIGGGAIVTKNIPPMAIVGGNPAKVIRFIDDDAKCTE